MNQIKDTEGTGLHRGSRKYLNVASVAVWTVVFGLFLAGMPKYHDDYWFMEFLHPWFESQGIANPDYGGDILGTGIPWQAVIDTWTFHFGYDNIRLGNLLAPLLLLLPKWFGSGIITLLLGWSVILSLKLAGIDWMRSRLLPLSLALWTFLLPWWDHLGCLVFQLNYIFPTWLCLLLVNFVAKRSTHTIVSLTELFLLALAAGMSHEGFAAPMLASFTAVLIFFRECRNIRTFIAIAGLLSGFGLLFMSPGMTARFTESSFAGYGSYVAMALLTEDGPALALLIFMLIWCALRNGLRRTFGDKLVVFALVSISAVILLTLMHQNLGRTQFWCIVMALTATLKLIASLGHISRHIFRQLAIFGSYALFAAAIGYMVCVDIESLKMRRLLGETIKRYHDNGETVTFGDLSILGRKMAIVGDLPDISPQHTAVFYLGNYFCDRNPLCDKIAIVPESLQNVIGLAGEELPGGTGVRVCDGLLFCDGETAKRLGVESTFSSIRLSADYGSGDVPVELQCFRFESQADGRDYVWLSPRVSWYVANFKELKSLVQNE